MVIKQNIELSDFQKSKMRKIAFIVYGNLSESDTDDKIIDEKIKIYFRKFINNCEFDIFINKNNINKNIKYENYNLIKFKLLEFSNSFSNALKYFIQNSYNKHYKILIVLKISWLNSLTENSDLLLFDESLPCNYIYTKFEKSIDHYYNTDWIWGSPDLIMKLQDVNIYTMNIINSINATNYKLNHNHYQRRNLKPKLHSLSEDFYLALIKMLNFYFVRKIILYSPSVAKKYNGAIARANRELQRRDYIIETYGEELETKNNYINKIIQHEGELLKLFIYKQGLRESLRFINNEDFRVLN